MKRVSLKILKSTAATALAAVFLLASIGATSPGGWFASVVDLAVMSPSTTSGLFSVAGLGDGSSLTCTGEPSMLQLEDDQVLSLLELSSAGEFELAEAEFKSMAQSCDELLPESEFASSYGYSAYRLTYEFTYRNQEENPLGAYVKFVPRSNYMNMIGNSRVFCLQAFTCWDFGELPGLNFTNQDFAYYYPHELGADETITLELTVFLSDDDINYVDFDRAFEFQLTQADNNASVINWNVVFEDGDISAFDAEYLEEAAYYPFDIEFNMPEEGFEQVRSLHVGLLQEEEELVEAEDDSGENTDASEPVSDEDLNGEKKPEEGEVPDEKKEPGSGTDEGNSGSGTDEGNSGSGTDEGNSGGSTEVGDSGGNADEGKSGNGTDEGKSGDPGNGGNVPDMSEPRDESDAGSAGEAGDTGEENSGDTGDTGDSGAGTDNAGENAG